MELLYNQLTAQIGSGDYNAAILTIIYIRNNLETIYRDEQKFGVVQWSL
jgi:hypothetical protein